MQDQAGKTAGAALKNLIEDGSGVEVELTQTQIRARVVPADQMATVDNSCESGATTAISLRVPIVWKKRLDHFVDNYAMRYESMSELVRRGTEELLDRLYAERGGED